MNASEFRKELIKIMPGYKWTVHKPHSEHLLSATGVKSSGFNRLSTLVVECRGNYPVEGAAWYLVKSAGFGLRARFLAKNEDATLARALRGLQNHYRAMANTYRSHADALEAARKAMTEPEAAE